MSLPSDYWILNKIPLNTEQGTNFDENSVEQINVSHTLTCHPGSRKMCYSADN